LFDVIKMMRRVEEYLRRIEGRGGGGGGGGLCRAVLGK